MFGIPTKSDEISMKRVVIRYQRQANQADTFQQTRASSLHPHGTRPYHNQLDLADLICKFVIL